MTAWQGWADGAALTLIGGGAAWVLTYVWQWRKHRDDQAALKQEREDKLTEHNSGLAIELIKIANAEAATLRQQVSELRHELGQFQELDRRLMHFEEALFHIEKLLDPAETGREATESNARLFLAKMIALRSARGIANNSAQVELARRSLEQKRDAE